jgi:DNA-binding transcriptional LysR family regulator
MRFARDGARQALLTGPGTKGGLRPRGATASSFWGKVLDGLRGGDGLEPASFKPLWGFRKGNGWACTCNIPFGMLHVMPLIPRFLAKHPDVSLDLVLTDTVIDLMQERADVAIRVGPLQASRLVARKLGTSRMVVVGAPTYLARFGAPRTPSDLADHRGIGWTFLRSIRGWPFRRGDRTEEALPPPVARASDGEAARRLALGGVGLARLALFHIGPDIEAGRLVPVLQDYNPGDREDIHAVYVGHAAPLPARVRAFIDFLAKHVCVEDPSLKRAGGGKWKLAREMPGP